MKFYKINIILIFFLFVLNSQNAFSNIAKDHASIDIGVIVPMAVESQYFEKLIVAPKHLTKHGVKYTVGKVAGKIIAFANCGIGKVNAAAITARMISDYNPKLLIHFGSAGAVNLNLPQDAVIIGKQVIDADFGQFTASGTQFNFSINNPNNGLIQPLVLSMNRSIEEKLSHRLSKNDSLLFGRIGTTDNLPNPLLQVKLLRKNRVDATDMESVAVMQTCWLFSVKCIVVRGISNPAHTDFTLNDIALAAKHATVVVLSVIQM